jgi:O-antigen/teichoic acid export membrane protein
MGIVKRDGLKLVLISWIGIALGFFNRLILFAKYLETEEVGLTVVLINISVLFAQIASLGLAPVILKFFPYFNNSDQKHYGFLTWVFKLTTIGSIVTILFFLIFKEPITLFFAKKSPLLVEYYYCIIPLGLASVSYIIFDAYLRSQLDTVFSSFAWEIILRLATTVSIILYAFNMIDFKWFVIIYVIANCTASFAILIYMYANKNLPFTQITTKVVKYKKHLLWFATFSVLSGAGNNFMMLIDSIFVSGFINLKAAGIFTTVGFVASVMIVPYRAIVKITSPIVANLWRKKDMVEMDKLYKNTSVVCLLIGAYFFCGCWICIDELFALMPKGDIYKEGKYVFLILCIGKLFDMTTGINGVIVITSKKYRYDLFFTFFLIISTLICNYVFIKVLCLGINGAALATCISIVVYNILRVAFLYFHYKLQPLTFKFILGLLLFLIVLFGCIQIPSIGPPLVSVFIKGLVLTIVYWSCIYIFKVNKEINSSINKVLNRFKLLKM